MSHVLFFEHINVRFVEQRELKVQGHLCILSLLTMLSLAHTIKYCQATGDENNQHIPTPYEKMMRTQCMQSFPFDENFTSTYPTLFDPLAASPSSLYTNGWSNSYL